MIILATVALLLASARSLFLHVLEVADEEVRQATNVKLVGAAGLDIGDRWKLRFHAERALGGTIGGALFATTVQNEAQYR